FLVLLATPTRARIVAPRPGLFVAHGRGVDGLPIDEDPAPVVLAEHGALAVRDRHALDLVARDELDHARVIVRAAVLGAHELEAQPLRSARPLLRALAVDLRDAIRIVRVED